MEIHRLDPSEVERYKVIRLRSLQDTPDAFDSTLEELSAWEEARWESQMQRPIWVTVLDGRDAGLVRVMPEKDQPGVAYLISMWMEPEARRQNVGGALVDAAVHWSRAHELRTLKLDVGNANAPAIALYASRGFLPQWDDLRAARAARPYHRTSKGTGTLRPPTQFRWSRNGRHTQDNVTALRMLYGLRWPVFRETARGFVSEFCHHARE